jgi:hypothetical protein
MENLPEDIQIKISKNVHELGYSFVMEQLFKNVHGTVYSIVMDEMIELRINKLYDACYDVMTDYTSEHPFLEEECKEMYELTHPFLFGNRTPKYKQKQLSKIRNLVLFDKYPYLFEAVREEPEPEPENKPDENGHGPWTPAMNELSKRIDELERIVEAEKEQEPEITAREAHSGGFNRYTPSAAENELEELIYQLEVMNEHRMVPWEHESNADSDEGAQLRDAEQMENDAERRRFWDSMR